MLITEPGDTVKQVSAVGDHGRPLLVVVAKRTYTVTSHGRCVPAEEQDPLVVLPREEDGSPGVLAEDSDLFPFKERTDVVICEPTAFSGHPTRRLEVSIRVGRHSVRALVLGNRTCYRARGGRLKFSDPEPFERMPIGYDRAYGGKDMREVALHEHPLFDLFQGVLAGELDLDQAGEFAYPRNPAGKGYAVSTLPDPVETLELPNVEDPDDLLTPDRILAGAQERWPYQPLPAGFGWTDHTWFPRMSFTGVVPEHVDVDEDIQEVARGWIPRDVFQPRTVRPEGSRRFFNGASPGLQLPFLVGDEPCELEHLTPDRARFRFHLPGDRPKIWVDGRRGRLVPTDPELYTVRIHPEQRRVSLLWRGAASAVRQYTEEELETMPLKVSW